jgi:hypothetical protein
MKITSRPKQDDIETIGEGTMRVLLTQEQLELIAAFVYNTRLGKQSDYSQAAFEILELLSNEFGDDFIDDAATLVNLQVVIEDSHGARIVETMASGPYSFSLEV